MTGVAAETSGQHSTMNVPDDRFIINDVLGEGAQGQVCKAFDKHLQRVVAIKFPRRGEGETGGATSAVLDEARKAARLQHPNVVTIYECGNWQGRPFIAMEFVDGVSLNAILKESGRLNLSTFVRFSTEILKALEAAHSSGIVHRDLKPHNILQAKDGTLKLTDFGIAHVQGSGPRRDTQGAALVSGTPAYMAPEQWMGKPADHRTDIYAFGCVAYQMLAGRPPFEGRDSYMQHIEKLPTPVHELNDAVTESLSRVIMRCLAKAPAERFQSAREVREVIEALAVSEKLVPTYLSTANRKKKPVGTILVFALAGAAALAAFLDRTTIGKNLWRGLTGATPASKESTTTSDTDSPKSEVTNNDVDSKSATPTNAESTDPRLAEQERGLAALARARNATSPKERLDAAAEAMRSLLPGAALEEARDIEAAARREARAVTESTARSEFESALSDTDTALNANDLNTAMRRLDEADNLMRLHPTLNVLARSLDQRRLPLLQKQANLAAEQLRFADARAAWETAGNVAVKLGDEPKKIEALAQTDLCSKLDLLQTLVSRSPRLVVVQLERLRVKDLPIASPRLIQARALAALGQRSAAKDVLASYLESPNALAKEDGTKLMAVLD